MSKLDPSGPPMAVIVKEPRKGRTDGPSRCLVLDAAFNPPTLAHWELAMLGAQASNADWVLIQLSSANVDKGVISGADLKERLYMLDHIASKDDRIGVSACSHARFVDKVEALSRVAENTRFIFAIGYDTLVRLFDTKYYHNIEKELGILFEMAEFVVANRGEHDAEALEAYLNKRPAASHNNNIRQVILPQHLAGISSSKTRNLIGAGKPFSHCVPSGLPELIAAMGLYKK